MGFTWTLYGSSQIPAEQRNEADLTQLNGWQPGVLAKAMKTCNAGNTGLGLDEPQCFGAGSIQSGAQKDACTIAPSVNEDIGATTPLNALPGCNPIQPGPGLATKPANCAVAGKVADPTSVAAPVASTTAASDPVTTTAPSDPVTTAPSDPAPSGTNDPSESGQSPASVNSKSGVWKAAGCFRDALNPRSLGQQPEWWGAQITSSNCVAHCDSIGAKYAGTENGGQCFCGNQLNKSAKVDGKCTAKCNGDASEICGGPALLSVYSLDGTVALSKRTHQRHSRHFKGIL